MCNKQLTWSEAIEQVMLKNGYFATLKQLNDEAPKLKIFTGKTPHRTIAERVQRDKRFTRIMPGLWALSLYLDKLPDHLNPKIEKSEQEKVTISHALMRDADIIEKAAKIAVIAHGDDLLKGDGSPYIVHPFMVALKLAKHNFSSVVIAAALVHDVLEDTPFSKDILKAELGDEVFRIVKALTNDNDKTLSWEEKKKRYIETVRNGSDDAKAVAAADKIHNLESLLIAHAEQGADIWTKFNSGKEQKICFENEMLKMLKESWQHPLIEEYEHLLEQVKNL